MVPQISERFDAVSWWLLDAADYGVPQRRRRVFLGAGPTRVEAPPPTHSGEALEAAKADGRYWAAVSAGDWAELDARPGELRPWRTIRQTLRLPMSAQVTGGGSNPHHVGEERRTRDL